MADPDWELYYWPLAGRGEFVRLVFEEAGVKFKEINDVTKIRTGINGGEWKEIFPTFAPPMIKKGDFTLSQTSVICRYLGKEFDLYPDNWKDEAHAEQLNVTIHDYMAEGCLVFHGKAFIDSYDSQKEETKPYIDWFVSGRMQRWLKHFECALEANQGGKGFLVGTKLTYVDLALLHVLRASESQFPEAWSANDSIPLLRAYKDRMSARPRLAEYFKSDRCKPFEGNSMM